jgi:hypothetical protein
MIIGFYKTLLFFGKRDKIFGTVLFFLGIMLVFMRWAFIGVIVEAFGFVSLFGYGIIPHVKSL